MLWRHKFAVLTKQLQQVRRHIKLLIFKNYLKASLAITRLASRHGGKTELLVWIVLSVVAGVGIEPLQILLEKLLSERSFIDLRALILAVGAALVGATAIVTSFVLFAMQTNVERLPYSLFHRFSSDFRLHLTFGAAFFAAISGTALSLIRDPHFAALQIVLAVGAVFVVLRLLLHAFRRSIRLVNPMQQLLLVRRRAEKHTRIFISRVEKMISIVMPTDGATQHSQDQRQHEPTLDVARFEVLRSNPGWDRPLQQAVSDAISYARRAGERGDIEVVGVALATVVKLNALYVEVKGRTFHGSHWFSDGPLTTDRFINHTLEELRRLRQSAQAQRDESQIERVLHTFALLVSTYAAIEYPGYHVSKTHALLPAGYMADTIEASLALDLPDLTMEGVRLLGRTALTLFDASGSTDMVTVASKIGLVGATGVFKPNYRPITLTAMEQYRDITIHLITNRKEEIGFAVGEIRDAVIALTQTFLAVEDERSMSTHSTYLAPYFSATSESSLRSELTKIVTWLNQCEPDEYAATVADNIEEWAEEWRVALRETLIAAVAKRSRLAVDLMHWVTGTCEILLATAAAPSTNEQTANELKDHAGWLFSSLGWIPREPDTAEWVSNYSFVKIVFDFGVVSNTHGFTAGYDQAWDILFRWGMEGGRQARRSPILYDALVALVALSLLPGRNDSQSLRKRVEEAIVSEKELGTELRVDVANRLLRKADKLEGEHVNSVDRALSANDSHKTEKLLEDLSHILMTGLKA